MRRISPHKCRVHGHDNNVYVFVPPLVSTLFIFFKPNTKNCLFCHRNHRHHHQQQHYAIIVVIVVNSSKVQVLQPVDYSVIFQVVLCTVALQAAIGQPLLVVNSYPVVSEISFTCLCVVEPESTHKRFTNIKVSVVVTDKYDEMHSDCDVINFVTVRNSEITLHKLFTYIFLSLLVNTLYCHKR